jgi:methylglutamate dehydrogenase subunit D
MSDTRHLPLRDVAKTGRYGADKGDVGVTLSILHPMSLVMVIARKGQANAVKSALAKVANATVMSAGPDQFYVQSEASRFAELSQLLKGQASVIDQSHGRVIIRIAGPRVRDVLAKGAPVDLHPAHFAIGHSAQTTMAHVGIHLTRSGDNEFTLSVFRGFSRSFWEWLTQSAAEFGYSVT